MRSQYDTVIIGIAIGACFPVLSYLAIQTIFDTLTSMNLIDGVTSSSALGRERSLFLFAICGNIIPIQIMNKKKWTQAIRGLMFPTFFYIAFWMYTYGPYLLHNF